MNKLILILTIMVFSLYSSQNGEGIEISTEITGSQNIPNANYNILTSKLENFLTQNGIVKGINSQFALVGSVDVLQSQNIGGNTGNLLMYDLVFSSKIVNVIDGNVFAQNSTSTKGMGDNNIKALNNALSKIDFNTQEFRNFLENGKTKIIDYYTKNCDRITREVTLLENTAQYEFALYKLTSIPPAATKCYQTAMNKAQVVYTKKINYDCKANLNAAKLAWSASQNWEGAQQVQSYLRNINPESTCIKDVNVFATEVGKRIKEIDGREWNLQYEQEVGLEKDRIQAIKEIGKAYGAGQPKQIINNNKIKF